MKKQVSLLVVLLMVLSVFSGMQIYANDYAGHWAKGSIEDALEKGYLTGFPDGSMQPDRGISRAEFVKLINHSLNFSESESINFSDVATDAWYYREVAVGVKAGYIKGISTDEFRPNDILTREQAAKMIAAAEGYGKAKTAPAFTDGVQIADWAKDGVAACVEQGIIKGMPDGSFAPQRQLTRGEAVTMIEKCFAATALNPKDAQITKEGQVLKYRTYKNVEIAKSLGKGKATLRKVRIKGNLTVRGGGRNSVYLEDVVVDGQLIVDKEDGQVRIHISGQSSIGATILESGAVLEEENIVDGYQGLTKIEVSPKVPKGHEVGVKGTANLEIKNKDIKVSLNENLVQNEPTTPTVSTSDSNGSPYLPLPSTDPEPSPEPEPEPTPGVAPEFIGQPEIEEEKDANGDPVYYLVVKTKAEADIYVIATLYDSDAAITRRQVLSGLTPSGAYAGKYYAKTTENSGEYMARIKLNDEFELPKTLNIVATTAEIKNRLTELNKATEVVKYQNDVKYRGFTGLGRVVIYAGQKLAEGELKADLFTHKPESGTAATVEKAKVISVPDQQGCTYHSAIILELNSSFDWGTISYDPAGADTGILMTESGTKVDAFSLTVISDMFISKRYWSKAGQKIISFLNANDYDELLGCFRGERFTIVGEGEVSCQLERGYKQALKVSTTVVGEFEYVNPESGEGLAYEDLTTDKLQANPHLLSPALEYIDLDLGPDEKYPGGNIEATYRLSSDHDQYLIEFRSEGQELMDYDILPDSFKLTIEGEIVDPFFVDVYMDIYSGDGRTIVLELIDNSPYSNEEDYTLEYDPRYVPTAGDKYSMVYLLDVFGDKILKENLTLTKDE